MFIQIIVKRVCGVSSIPMLLGIVEYTRELSRMREYGYLTEWAELWICRLGIKYSRPGRTQ